MALPINHISEFCSGKMKLLTANPKIRKSASSAKTKYEPMRTGLSPKSLARAFRDNLFYAQGRIPEVANPHDWYAAYMV
jgi:hypothetical protein